MISGVLRSNGSVPQPRQNVGIPPSLFCRSRSHRTPAAAAASALAPFPNGVQKVDAVGMTVGDMDRSVEFFSKVLSFEKVSDVEVTGNEYEHLQGVFGLRMRVVRMRLGDEFIELTEYLAPKGRPIPVDSRSNDRWFQHIAIITSDMGRGYQWLRANKAGHASTGPQRLPDWNKAAGGIKAFYVKDADGHFLEILQFPPDKGDPKWRGRTDRRPRRAAASPAAHRSRHRRCAAECAPAPEHQRHRPGRRPGPAAGPPLGAAR